MLKQVLTSSIGLLVAATVSASEGTSSQHTAHGIKQPIKLETRVGSLAANLYLPQGVENPPVVIITGAWTTVKEQMQANYAEALAEQGYAAVTFDFRGWGQSKDTIPYLEDPQRKSDDIRAVIEAVSQLDTVDGSRVAGLGICASSGYMLDAAAGNNNIQSVAVVAPWLHDKAMATAIYGGEESVTGLLSVAEQAINSEEPMVIEAASLTNSDALMYQVPYYTESDRGLIPEYDNRFNLASWQGWLNYDAQVSATIQDKPVLMVASEAMALPAGAHDYLDKSGDNVEAVWLDGVSQFDFYDKPEVISTAVAALKTHFDTTL